MVKIPSEAGLGAPGVEERTQMLHDLGVLMALWSHLELFIEVAIWQITKMSGLHASILLGGLQHKSKISILYALLRLDGKDATISKMKTAMSYAKRNALIHSALGTEDDFSQFAFFYRSIDDRYKVTKHSYTATTFHNHVWHFRDLANAALDDLPVTHEQIDNYGKQAKFDGINP